MAQQMYLMMQDMYLAAGDITDVSSNRCCRCVSIIAANDVTSIVNDTEAVS